MSRTTLARAATATLFSVALSASCSSDTLYDSIPRDIPGPLVEVSAPVTGIEVLAGRSFRLLVAAEDSLGIAELDVALIGAATTGFRRTYSPAPVSILLDTLISTPVNSQGPLEVRARVRNTRGAVGVASVQLRVAAADTIAPTVNFTATIPPRVELTDTFHIRVTAQDNEGGSGLVRLGFTALFINANVPADTFVIPGTVRELSAPSRDPQAFELRFPPNFVNPTTLPYSFNLEIHAFAVDSAGNCAVRASSAPVRSPCRQAAVEGVQVVLGQAAAPQQIATMVVSGRSVRLPAGAWIADALPDVSRERLYMSNLPGYKLEVLNLRQYAFESSVAVGAQPWGLAFNRQKDTVLVANSGGTSISSVAVVGQPREIVSRRFHTPNLPLFEVDFLDRGFYWNATAARFYDFSDRPQFLAQDAEGRIVFSTRPAQLDASRAGTIRVAELRPGQDAPEVRLQLISAGAIVSEGDRCRYESNQICTISVAHIDSVKVYETVVGEHFVEMFDHVPGHPDQIIRTGIVTLDEAIYYLVNHPDSDIFWGRGRWNRAAIALQDTTYIAVSGDHKKVAIGEGGTGAGRISIWDSDDAEVSSVIKVADLVGNTFERILGLNLNHDGSFAVARGSIGSYYFTDDLRLQGSDVELASAAGGAGAALFPTHPTYRPHPAASNDATLSFVATNQRTIRIFDTVHFRPRGDIQLRDNIVGPLRVSQPLPGDPCIQNVCPVAKVYGVTAAGTVVVVDVLPTQIGPPF